MLNPLKVNTQVDRLKDLFKLIALKLDRLMDLLKILDREYSI